MGFLNRSGYLQRVAMPKVWLVFPSLRFRWSWKMGKGSSILLNLGIVISNSIKGLFLRPGVQVCHGGGGMNLVRAWVCDVKATRSSCHNYIMDSKKRFLDNSNT